MKLTALIIFIAQAAVPSAAFAPAPFGKTAVSQQLSSSVSPSLTSSSRLFVSSSVKPTDIEVPITVTGNNIDVTDALVEYVQKKLERPLGKLRANGTIRHCDVHLSVNKNPKVKDSHRVEVTTSVKGTTFRSSESSPDMYASIDAVSDRLARKLRKYKERRLNGFHGGSAMGSDLADALQQFEDEEAAILEMNGFVQEPEPVSSTDANKATADDMVDPYAPEVTKTKSFDLSKPTSLEEAIFALDYVDHDFYFFRNEATNELNVVYKRNAGGIGLIQPQ